MFACKGGGEKVRKDLKKFFTTVAIKSVEKIAIQKANSNCLGLLYEPKRPIEAIKKR